MGSYRNSIYSGNGSQGIYSVDFYNENIGIIVGGDYSKPNENKANKAITSDGGKTWTLVADGESPNYKSSVKYIPRTKGKEVIAVGKTGVSFSNDGGRTWKDVSKEGYYAIDFVWSSENWEIKFILKSATRKNNKQIYKVCKNRYRI